MAAVTHDLETLLDRVRKQELALSERIIDITLVARDVLLDQLAAHQGGEAVQAERVEQVIACIRAIAADKVGSDALAVLLTGMDKDGAVGLLRMREQSALTLTQSPESCVAYGMPRTAFELGASMALGTLGKLAEKILTTARQKD